MRDLAELVGFIAAVTSGADMRCSVANYATKNWHSFEKNVVQRCVEDIESYLARDPALYGNSKYALSRSGPYVSVMGYRVASWLWQNDLPPSGKLDAYALHQNIKALTGVEIHPAAMIGKRFIVDHGFGTVIGATAVVGDDCYLLNGITLGACRIANNEQNERHPTLGNNVQIGAFARILGNIKIGSGSFIGPLSCVVNDVAENSRIIAFINDHQAELLNSRNGTLAYAS